MPAMLRHENTPLSQVIDGLSSLAGINIHLDPRGSARGVHSDTLITVNLNRNFTKSRANLIPGRCTQLINDEVLRLPASSFATARFIRHLQRLTWSS
jgi:hypothetical protein